MHPIETVAKTDLLAVHDQGSVRTLMLNRPSCRNALDTALTQCLLDELRRAEADPAVRAVVMTGSGSVFCAGADLREFSEGDTAGASGRAARVELLRQLLLAVRTIPIAVVAAVNGTACGAGAAMAILADVTVMSEEARLEFPETRLGMVPSLMIELLASEMGRKATFELLVMAQPFGAARAVEAGLINLAVAPEQVLPKALQWAAGIATLERTVVSRTMQLLDATPPQRSCWNSPGTTSASTRATTRWVDR